MQHSPEGLSFNQNSVPFDFDGEHLIYMEYQPKQRVIFLYTVSTKELKPILTFTVKDQIISHCKLARNARGGLMVVYVQRSKVIVAYDVGQQTWEMVAAMPDAILALHVTSCQLREADRQQSQAINRDSNDLE